MFEFLVVTPNIVTKFVKNWHFLILCEIFSLSSVHACMPRAIVNSNVDFSTTHLRMDISVFQMIENIYIRLAHFKRCMLPPISSLNTLHAASRWLHNPYKIVLFLIIFSKFNKFLNRYQACLYLFECISHGDSTYYVVSKFQYFEILETLWNFERVVCGKC